METFKTTKKSIKSGKAKETKIPVETLGDLEDGNTISKSTRRMNQLKRWCFTFNNYKIDDIKILETKFKLICVKYVFQQEKGETNGTPHIQGAIWLKKEMRPSEFDLDKKIHWEGMRNEKASIAYCQKSLTAEGEPFFFGFPKPIKIIENLKNWQKEIEDLFFTEPDGRTVNWYWENIGGVGKSSFCKYMYVKHKAITIQGGKLADIMNIIFNLDMDETKMLIIDIPRNNSNKISYSAVECILNGMITNTKFETGVKVFNPPHVVILSNFEPEYEKLSLDRWNVKEI